MSQTVVPSSSGLTNKKYSAALYTATARKSYWDQRFIGNGPDSETPIVRLTELEKDAGDTITFDLSVQLKGRPTEGDDVLENNEEDLKMYTDELKIDQVRHGVNAGGKMTRKRTKHNLRQVGLNRLSDYFSRLWDEYYFVYCSGARGVNNDYILPTSFTGFAGNAVQAPDANHIICGATVGTGKATLTSGDKMSTAVVDRAVTLARKMGGGSTEVAEMAPISLDGEKVYVMVMSEDQAFSMRTATGTADWLEIHKAASTALGKNSPIFKGALGMHNGVVLHSHKAVIRFSDYGASSNLSAARAMLLGKGAMAVAYGSSGNGQRFDWYEETRDNGNQLAISGGAILGVKKARFNGYDVGTLAVDTYAAEVA